MTATKQLDRNNAQNEQLAKDVKQQIPSIYSVLFRTLKSVVCWSTDPTDTTTLFNDTIKRTTSRYDRKNLILLDSFNLQDREDFENFIVGAARRPGFGGQYSVYVRS